MPSIKPFAVTFIVSIIMMAFALISPTYASTVVEMDAQSLVANSSHIVLGDVASVTTRVGNDGRVYSTITIHVDRTIKGSTPGNSQIVIHQLGGRSGDFITRVAGMPEFEEQEAVLLFLEQNKPDAPAVVTGLSQGKFRIVRGPDDKTQFVVPQMENLHLIKRPQQLNTNPPIQGAKTLPNLRFIPAHDLYSTVFELNDFIDQIQVILRDQENN